MCDNQASKRSIFTSNVWSGLYYLGVVFLNAEQRVKRVHSSYQASRNLKISLRRCPHKNNFNELRERFNCTFYILQVVTFNGSEYNIDCRRNFEKSPKVNVLFYLYQILRHFQIIDSIL